MPLHFVTGDPSLTRAQTLAFSHNAKGQVETRPLQAHLMRQYPAAFASYQQSCRKERVKAGAYFLWRESRPRLIFMVVRDSAVGATRLRYVQSASIALARDYRLEGIRSLAIAPMGQDYEQNESKKVLETWFASSTFPVIVYDEYVPGVQAEEPSDLS